MRRSEEGDHLTICIAHDGSAWHGMAAGRWGDETRRIAHLWGMWVDPAVRGGGVGDALVQSVCRWAASHGAEFVRLGVAIGPGDATGFYERIGFVVTGEHEPMRRDPARSVHYLVRPV